MATISTKEAAQFSFTMDTDGHLTIQRRGTTIFEGSYEAFCADGDVRIPITLAEKIHARHERDNALSLADDQGFADDHARDKHPEDY